MLLGAACLLTLVLGACCESWPWPDNGRTASVRIDTKVRFVDDERRPNKVQADEIKPPVGTEGFYNRPAMGAGSGRYAVQSQPHSQRVTSYDVQAMKLIRPSKYSDGTLDSLQYCKCVLTSTATCHSRGNSEKACPVGQSLCCYTRPNRNPHSSDSGIFSELEDERPMLLPNYERSPGAFTDNEDVDLIGGLKPAGNGFQHSGEYHDLLFGPGGPRGIIAPVLQGNRVLAGPHGPTGRVGPEPKKQVLIGPDGPTGIIGPSYRDGRYQNQRRPGILVGPEGPTGVIGPNHGDNRHPARRNPGVLVGPDGPSGLIGPNLNDNRIKLGPHQNNPAVLVGPQGPTGVIGPNPLENSVLAEQTYRGDRNFIGSPSHPKQHPEYPDVLVGPEGPTGQIGPNNRAHQVLVGPGGPTGGIGPDHKQGVSHAESAQVLVGPGGPTGIIGPGGRRGRWQTGSTGPGILIGPGGPTGIIGPGQRLLVGPGGPTGRIGPRGGRMFGGYGF